MYYPVETQATPLTTVRRERLLPVPGEVIVHAHDEVSPQQVVAQANMPGEFRIVPVAAFTSGSQAARYCEPSIDRVENGAGHCCQRGWRCLGQAPIMGSITASGGAAC